tara:strand:- start:195 stop:380 length:186 start_codon:yes stop_codon:yes gene_type:complete
MRNEVNRDTVEHAARMYHSSKDAAVALGIAAGSFGRLCRQYGIETPGVRKARERKAARNGT